MSRPQLYRQLGIESVFDDPWPIKSLHVERESVTTNVDERFKGAFDVYVRIRPVTAKEIDRGTPQSIEVIDESKSIKVTTARGEKMYENYKNIFQQEASQETVYQEMKEFIQYPLNGINLCFITYGPVGTGKVRSNSLFYIFCLYHPISSIVL